MGNDDRNHIPFCYFRATSKNEWLEVNDFLRTHIYDADDQEDADIFAQGPSAIFIHSKDYAKFIDTLNATYQIIDQHILMKGVGKIRTWKSLQAQVIERVSSDVFIYEAWMIDIDLLKRAEEYLSLFRQTVEYAVIGVTISDFFDKEMPIIYANPAFYQMTGYSPEEILGSNLRFLQSDDRNQHGIDEIRNAIHEQRGCTVELRNYRKDGSIFWNELTIAPLYNDAGVLTHYVGLQRDVTSRKKYEHQLQLTAAVFDNMDEGVFITDENGVFLEVNNAFSRITGYSREEVIGKQTNLLKSGFHEASFYRQMWEKVKQNGSWKGRIINRRKNGEIFEEFLSIIAVPSANHQTTQYISTFSAVYTHDDYGETTAKSAYYDPLTKLPNRILFLDRLNMAIERAKRSSTQLAVCSMDVDDFQQTNLEFGHDGGDRLLVELSNRIQKSIRKYDTVSRPSGDEFVLLVQDLRDIPDFNRRLAEVMNELSKPFLIHGKVIYPTVSVGITFFPFHGDSADELLRNADKAMYRSKDTGKNHYSIYSAEQDHAANIPTFDYVRLYQALKDREFTLYYQPKVEMRQRKVYGVEALIRWRHPEQGLLAPGSFLPSVQHTDFMILLDDWVKEEALRQMEIWQEKGLRLKVSVNLSARRIQYGNFPAHLKKMLKNHPQVNPEDLELELLETDELGNLQESKKIIESCRELGVRVSLDDFGSGYSSLTYLSQLPLDILKIDQTFVRNMSKNEGNLAIISAVIELSKVFQCEVIAEGVETLEQGKTLIQMGCDLAQGFYIARPMPPEELEDWIQNWNGVEEWEESREMNVTRYLSQLFLLPLEHRQWVDQLVSFLQSTNDQNENPPELDAHACQFGRWYDHMGKNKFGNVHQMREIRSIHDQIHQQGRVLVNLKKIGRVQDALAGIDQLIVLRDRLLELFHEFVLELDRLFAQQIS